MKIIWSEPAVADLENIRDYIAKDSPYYAAIFVEKIITAVEKTATFPLMGRIVPEYNNKNIREVIYQTNQSSRLFRRLSASGGSA